jgi:hypothetical protein
MLDPLLQPGQAIPTMLTCHMNHDAGVHPARIHDGVCLVQLSRVPAHTHPSPISCTHTLLRTKQMTVYFGTVGYPCPQFSNPSDFVLSLVNTDFPGHGDMTMLEAAYVHGTMCDGTYRDRSPAHCQLVSLPSYHEFPGLRTCGACTKASSTWVWAWGGGVARFTFCMAYAWTQYSSGIADHGRPGCCDGVAGSRGTPFPRCLRCATPWTGSMGPMTPQRPHTSTLPPPGQGERLWQLGVLHDTARHHNTLSHTTQHRDCCVPHQPPRPV